MTITELLATTYYRGNQTLLAKDLNINRSTLRAYVDDTYGHHHMVIQASKSTKEFYTNQSNKVNR